MARRNACAMLGIFTNSLSQSTTAILSSVGFAEIEDFNILNPVFLQVFDGNSRVFSFVPTSGVLREKPRHKLGRRKDHIDTGLNRNQLWFGPYPFKRKEANKAGFFQLSAMREHY